MPQARRDTEYCMLPVLPASGTYSTGPLDLTGSHGWAAADLGLPWRAAAHGADRARDDGLFARLGPDGIAGCAVITAALRSE